MRMLTVAALFLALPACIEFDEELVFDDDEPTPVDTGDRPDRPTRPDAEPPPTPTTDVTVSPSSGALCDVLLVSVAHPDDLAIVEVAFFGPSDVEVLAVDERPAELLVTVQIPSDGALGVNDVLLETDAGETFVVEDAFTVDVDGC
jgi:hypothetical protein